MKSALPKLLLAGVLLSAASVPTSAWCGPVNVAPNNRPSVDLSSPPLSGTWICGFASAMGGQVSAATFDLKPTGMDSAAIVIGNVTIVGAGVVQVQPQGTVVLPTPGQPGNVSFQAATGSGVQSFSWTISGVTEGKNRLDVQQGDTAGMCYPSR